MKCVLKVFNDVLQVYLDETNVSVFYLFHLMDKGKSNEEIISMYSNINTESLEVLRILFNDIKGQF